MQRNAPSAMSKVTWGTYVDAVHRVGERIDHTVDCNAGGALQAGRQPPARRQQQGFLRHASYSPFAFRSVHHDGRPDRWLHPGLIVVPLTGACERMSENVTRQAEQVNIVPFSTVTPCKLCVRIRRSTLWRETAEILLNSTYQCCTVVDPAHCMEKVWTVAALHDLRLPEHYASQRSTS